MSASARPVRSVADREATAERMVLVDEDLKPLSGKSGGGRPNPGTRFHIWIYRKRPDVQAIVPPALSSR